MLIIDADSIVYKAGFSSQKRLYIYQYSGSSVEASTLRELRDKCSEIGLPLAEENILHYAIPEPVSHALHLLNLILESIMDDIPATHRVDTTIYISDGKPTFRHSIAKTAPYKGNRLQDKPLHYESLRAHLVDIWGAKKVSGIEADDACAITLSENKGSILAGIDKDLLQVAGTHYNFDKKVYREISEWEGWYNFYSQTLIGDLSDNIKGIPKIGTKRASIILGGAESKEEMYSIVRDIYKEHKDLDLEENCRLLYLLRSPDDEWKPPV